MVRKTMTGATKVRPRPLQGFSAFQGKSSEFEIISMSLTGGVIFGGWPMPGPDIERIIQYISHHKITFSEDLLHDFLWAFGILESDKKFSNNLPSSFP
jgi:hypothetical protein